MPPSTLSAEAKAAIRANLELELKNRKEKLHAMCEAQVASLRSRLERRVNRIPASKRSMKLVDLLDSAVPATKSVAAKAARAAPARKQPAPASGISTASAPLPVPAPVRPTAPTAAGRKTRTAPAPAAHKEAPKAVTRPAPKTNRGKKRPSDDGDKENEELDVPKKRVKTIAPAKSAAATAARSTRAASRRAVPSQVLSPKPDNGRPTVARTRRQR